ncbi:hypothetical protein [Pantoea vagans]|uniref:hypothetical protein n=1 Tax=Pantoea vagans TaxID=470934 RepID=UPI003018444A
MRTVRQAADPYACRILMPAKHHLCALVDSGLIRLSLDQLEYTDGNGRKLFDFLIIYTLMTCD